MNARIVALVGPRAVGKTTVGALLAQELGVAFVDCDAALAAQVGCSAGDYLERVGEPRFRKLEEQVTVPLLEAAERSVVALGGGAILSAAVRGRLVRDTVFTVFLFAPAYVLAERITESQVARPRLTALPLRREVESLFAARVNRYRDVADATFDTVVQDPLEIARAIAERVER